MRILNGNMMDFDLATANIICKMQFSNLCGARKTSEYINPFREHTKFKCFSFSFL